MAMETVQAVRQAELNAAQLEKEAIQKRELILAEAQQNAKSMITSMTKEALAKAEQKLLEANGQGAKRMETSKQNAEKEVLLMKEMLKSKEQEAIKLVLSSVI
jgi:V/A-type H+/Na+-transporting ATPase subunit G/H